MYSFFAGSTPSSGSSKDTGQTGRQASRPAEKNVYSTTEAARGRVITRNN